MPRVLSVLGYIAGLVGTALVDAFSVWMKNRQADQNAKDLGAAGVVIKTNETLRRASDDQAKVDAVERGGAGDVERRLRESLEPKRPA